jgi:hypothetical protein
MVVAANHPALTYHGIVVAANHPALTCWLVATMGWWYCGSSQPSCVYLLVGGYHGMVVAANHPAFTRWLAATMEWW